METRRSPTALIDTAAYVERSNAAFRARAAPLARRTRAAGVREQGTLEARMWLVGTCYDSLRVHRSLRRERGATREPSGGGKWIERTPARAAGLTTDHRWTIEELKGFVVPPVPRYPKDAGGDLNGWWRPLVRHDHGSIGRYRSWHRKSFQHV